MKNIKYQWCQFFFLLILCAAASISEAQNPEPEATVIPIGRIDAAWKGMLSIPVWAETDVFFTGTTPVVLPEDVRLFKLKVDWQGSNKTRLDQESSVIMKVEVEDPPYSGNWKLVFEKRDDIVCKKDSSSQKIIASEPITQNKSEIRYKISLSSVLAVGPRSGPKETYLVVKLSSISYDTYTTIPFIPIAVLHDPSGDHSWSGIKASSCLLRLLSLQLGNKPLFIHDQKEILFHDSNGSFRAKQFDNQENYLEISFFPNIDITSEETSEDSCLIGPGLGDVYVIAKNLPLKLSLAETFSHKIKSSKLFYTIVSPEEAGFGPDKKFEIMIVSAADLRFFEEGHPVFGTWQQYGITDSFREQLIKINPGWDNVISPYEKDSLKYLTELSLNSKNQPLLPVRWNQEILHPLTVDLEMDILPSFVEKLQLFLPKGTVPMNITMNSKPYARSTIPEDTILSISDNEQGDKFPDFFSYDVYLDRYFGTPLFITKDDKTTPADIRSLHVRSISSSPQEFWTGTYETPIISGQITAIDGKIPQNAIIYLKQNDKVIKKDVASTDGFYKISVPLDDNEYSLFVQCAGYEDVTIPAITFSPDKRNVVVNASMPVKPEPRIEIEPIKKIAPQIPDKEMVIIEEKLPAKVLSLPEVLPPVMLLKNNDFSDKMKNWNILQEGLGTMKIIVTDDDEKADAIILDIHRQNSEKNTGSLGIMQAINQNVSRYNQVSLSMDVKIISLEDAVTVEDGIYPVVIEIEYADKNGKACLWKKIFSVTDGADSKKIPVDQWITYVSPNLAELKPKPHTISNIKMYGNGYDFHFRITGLVFVAKEMVGEAGVNRQLVETRGTEATTGFEKATVTTKSAAVVPEKATVTTKPAVVVSEKATVTTKPAPVAAIEKPIETKGAIKNYNFSSDTKCWDTLKVGSGQIMNLSVAGDSGLYPHVLDINRQGSGKQKGLLGLSQSINLDVATHTLITLSAAVKLLSATLESDGKKGGVYPVTLEITYNDKAGKEHSWRHGFLEVAPLAAGKRLNYPEIGEMVAGNTWVAYKSANLAKLKPRPKASGHYLCKGVWRGMGVSWTGNQSCACIRICTGYCDFGGSAKAGVRSQESGVS
ncbi:carboxypeptidase regulatory-like domain-containing protein [Candidatus Desantisbacteria bacterium]|nr:carboxypeptidase regulatory-like domain-containing protein [Candidatus Desantisbacteria bacterium]